MSSFNHYNLYKRGKVIGARADGKRGKKVSCYIGEAEEGECQRVGLLVNQGKSTAFLLRRAGCGPRKKEGNLANLDRKEDGEE